MVKITEELIRKKSEHNEGIIGTLEELSLHQEDVDRIEHINNWCKHLTILYLQSNLISKIENLSKLKNLQYLNLALNNIERVENLERCECLEKLDLTLNFVGDIRSVCSLRHNEHLRELYMTGNPCTDYEHYREYVIAKLPQLQCLDGVTITRSERIKALQIVDQIGSSLYVQQREYETRRQAQRETIDVGENLDDDEFWKTTTPNAPEVRVEISRRSRKNRKKDVDEQTLNTRPPVRLFDRKTGRPLNVNEAKLPFTFDDSKPDTYTLDIAVYKHLDTSLIEVDLQPRYVTVRVKGKVFQFVIPDEVSTSKSTVQRSQTTGHIVINLIRLRYDRNQRIVATPALMSGSNNPLKAEGNTMFLDVVKPKFDMDFSKILENYEKSRAETNFADVPPLEMA